MTRHFEIPSTIANSYGQLFNLCQNQTNDGRLTAAQVAEFLKVDKNWLLRQIYSGTCPFAFGGNLGVGRGTVCIHSLPFYSFITQGVLFHKAEDKPKSI